MKHIRNWGFAPSVPYSATTLPNHLQRLVALYASSDSAGTWSVAEEMGVKSNE